MIIIDLFAKVHYFSITSKLFSQKLSILSVFLPKICSGSLFSIILWSKIELFTNAIVYITFIINIITFMKIKTLALSVFTALLLTACGNGNKQDELEAKAQTSDKWQEIKPQEIDVNTVKMFADDWMLLSAGKDTSMNMMTIAWGGLGEVWGKPVVTIYVSTDRYTYKFLEENEYFTVTAFPEEYRDRIFDMTSYENINDIFLVTDLLITDYSSSIYEFSLMNKPMLFYAFDRDEYCSERGFHRDYESNVPGRIVTTFDELVDAIYKEDYEFEKVAEYVDKNFDRIDCHSSERVIKAILKGRGE